MQTELVQFIRDQIRLHGPRTFAWFMEQALYHPECGYYASDRAAIGHSGDYFTNVSVGPLFGQLLTAQFAESWEKLGQKKDFVLVEQGAHHGQLARDVLESARSLSSDFCSSLRYWIIEPFPHLRERQSQTLQKFGGQVEWFRSLDELPSFSGIHFSNELLDSMPVHRLISTGEEWQEEVVGLDGEEFVFIQQSIVDPKLKEVVTKLAPRPKGYRTEINLAMLDWIENVATKLEHGLVLVIDYGFAEQDFYAPERNGGSLQVRAKHRLLPSPFQEIGLADISAHINWTSLARQAERCGFKIAGFTDQHHFLTGIVSRSAAEAEKWDAKAKRELQTLLHPEMLGRSFQVLALTKDAEFPVPPMGFSFARGPRMALGL